VLGKPEGLQKWEAQCGLGVRAVLLVQAMSASLNRRKAVDLLLKWLGRTSDYSETVTFKHPDFRGKNVTHVQREVPCKASERLIVFWQHGK
jgi:hypothetical protein